MTSWEDDIVNALNELGGSAGYERIYEEIVKLRPNLPATWKAIIRRRIQDLSSDSAGFKGGEDLFYSVEGLGAGVWGLRSSLKSTPVASDLPTSGDPPPRQSILTYRILRDSELGRKLKMLYQNRCQVCGYRIQLGGNSYYSEAHHIRPLGGEHRGPDRTDNIIILCPNHHAMCDYGAMKLSKPSLTFVEGHEVGDEFIDYHNSRIVKI